MKYISTVIAICIILAGCTASQPVKKSHQFKIKKDDFKGDVVTDQDKRIKTKIDLNFSFEEVEPSHPDFPLYIIPPDIGGVHWVLTGEGRKFDPGCQLRAYKMNPDDKADKKEKGHLKKVTHKKYKKVLKLDELLKGQNVPAGLYTLEATYSWYKKDPELDQNGYCPETPMPAECYTIFQGEITRQLRIELPHIP